MAQGSVILLRLEKIWRSGRIMELIWFSSKLDHIADAKSKNFYTALLPKLIADGLATKYDLLDSSGGSLTWGVEFREAETSDGDLVNVCDYLYDPISVKLTRDGEDVTAIDVLTGETVTGFFSMKQFDFRLLKIIS